MFLKIMKWTIVSAAFLFFSYFLFFIIMTNGHAPPFSRGLETPDEDSLVCITKVADDGGLLLEDGRSLRLFGVKAPSEEMAKKRYLGILSSLKNRRMKIMFIEFADPDSVLMFKRCGPHCGNAYQTWNPLASPIKPSFTLINTKLARYENILESDFSNPLLSKGISGIFSRK